MGRLFVHLLLLWGVLGRQSPLLRPHRDVLTTQGVVRGYLAGGEASHFAYFGLPYALPAIRSDRYKAPKPPFRWDGIFEGTHRIKCPQPDGSGEENCLVVNVFAPINASGLPVIVFVHGGAFQNGWGPHHPPSRLLREGFIIATFNYRLSSFGFLCLGIDDAPGNAGLKDQIAALYWINMNIKAFGGNPHDVTVYGTGSGAASIQFLLLSGLTKGILHKVIIESGSALSPMSMNYEPAAMALHAANTVGYAGSEHPQDLLIFYQNASIEMLINIHDIFLPCVENESYYSHPLLDMDPVHILKHGKYHNVPMLVVYSDGEGMVMIGKDSEKFNKPPENFASLLPNNLEFEDVDLRDKVADIVKEFYFGDSFNRHDTLENYAIYVNDVFSEHPIIKFAMLYGAKNTYSVYVMKTSLHELSQPRDTQFQKILTIMDYFYRTNTENENKQTVEQIITLWINFIKISDPTPLTTTLIPTIWQPVHANTDHNDDISTVSILQFPQLKMVPPHMNQRLLFLDNIYNRFYKPHVLTTSNNKGLNAND